jgi:hypothetical protein
MDMKKKATVRLFTKEQKDGVFVYKTGLLNDPEFREIADKLLKSLHAKYLDPITLNRPSLSKLDESDKVLATKIESYYKIPLAEFLAMFEYKEPVINRLIMSVEREPFFDGLQITEQLVIRVPITVRKEDFDNQWVLIENAQQNSEYFKKRLREIEEPGLLYALWKARNTKPKPTKFKDIAKQIKTGQLPGYSRRKHWEYNDVSSYYNRHKHLLENLYL